MKKFLLFFMAPALLAGCYMGPQGELVGVQPREYWDQANPYGMNYVHFGSFTMGPSDQDVPYALNTRSKTVTMPAFYIDIHEISNNEYRQFVKYVRDSLFLEQLYMVDEDKWRRSDHPAADRLGMDIEDYYDLYVDKGYLLNWEDFTQEGMESIMQDEENREAIFEFYNLGGESFYNRKQIKTDRLNYTYWWFNLDKASKKEGREETWDELNDLGQLHSVRRHLDRSQFIVRETINVYPDTLVWIHDYTYAYNEPLAENYFWHPAYDDYPVVGVTWGQAVAFNAWRTQIMNEWKEKSGETYIQKFRLPSEAEWEYAARGGRDLAPYPWGGPYIRNDQGCVLANFKPMRGDYVEDANAYTAPVESYSPNDYGLFNMAGNVAEWTNTAFDETVYDFAFDLAPDYVYHAKAEDFPAVKRKVIRGGSWKDIGYYCQTGTRAYEYSDTAKAYIGFRSVMSYLGRGKSGPKDEWN